MAARSEVLEYLNHLLDPQAMKDYCPNGLQVEGTPNIEYMVTGVTANAALIAAAIEKGADSLLVHHGLFWQGDSPTLVGFKQRRCKALLGHNLNLFAYHLPLDLHGVYGNNVQLAKKLGIRLERLVTLGGIPNLGAIGTLTPALSVEALQQRLNEQLGRAPLHIAGQATRIARIGWCSGAAQKFILDMLPFQVDAYLSGEVSLATVDMAQESGLHYFAAGHHATERDGVKALGQHLAQYFNIRCEFIDIHNPV
jgi:dinuclear metal center YbgI/SA1388 family protein